MTSRGWAAAAIIAAALSAALTVGVVNAAQRHYDRAFALRMAGTTAAYVAAVTPPPPPAPPPPPPRARRAPGARSRRAPPPPQPPVAPQATPVSPAARRFDLRALLTQARALRTLPGWTSDVEVYFGTAPLIDATAPPLSTAELEQLGREGSRWVDGAALVPLRDRDPEGEVVGAVALRPRAIRAGPLPGGIGFAVPAALLVLGAAAVSAIRRRPLRRGGYIAATVVLGAAAFIDVRSAARLSTDRWLFDTRRLLQEAATRLPAPRVRVDVRALAALVNDGDVVPGEPGESAARRVRIDGERRAVVSVLIGSNRWVELRTAPAELGAPRWLALLVPCVLLGPFAIALLRWAERTPQRPRRETAIAWSFLAPTALHLLVFTAGPLAYAVYLAGTANAGALLRDPETWTAFRNGALFALYVPCSVALALAMALAVDRWRAHWSARLLSAALLMPYVASVVGVALIWRVIFRATSLGSGTEDWLRDPSLALIALMSIALWAHVGGQALVLLAGLQRIPRSYLDAAQVDGAGAWRCFWRVTFPLLRPTVGFVAIMGLLGAVQMFALVQILTPSGPVLSSTEGPVHAIYRMAWGSRAFGSASAFALLLFLVLLVLRWPELRLLGDARARGRGRAKPWGRQHA